MLTADNAHHEKNNKIKGETHHCGFGTGHFSPLSY